MVHTLRMTNLIGATGFVHSIEPLSFIAAT